MNQDQPSPDRKAIMQLIAGVVIESQADYYDRIKAGQDAVGDGTGIVTRATDAILGMLDERTRATNIRQIENWRDWIKLRKDLQWLVREMDEAIAALKDATQTNANGVWLDALSKGANHAE